MTRNRRRQDLNLRLQRADVCVFDGGWWEHCENLMMNGDVKSEVGGGRRKEGGRFQDLRSGDAVLNTQTLGGSPSLPRVLTRGGD